MLISDKAPNFVWKTTEFPAARKGFTWSIILNSLLSEWTLLPPLVRGANRKKIVLATVVVQVLLWHDKKKVARVEEDSSSEAPDGLQYDSEQGVGKHASTSQAKPVHTN